MHGAPKHLMFFAEAKEAQQAFMVCLLHKASLSVAADAVDLALRVMLPMGPCSQGDGSQPPAADLTWQLATQPTCTSAHDALARLTAMTVTVFIPTSCCSSISVLPPCPALPCCWPYLLHVPPHHSMRLPLHSITGAALCQVGEACWSTTQLHHRTPFAWCQQHQQQQAPVQHYLRRAQLHW